MIYERMRFGSYRNMVGGLCLCLGSVIVGFVYGEPTIVVDPISKTITVIDDETNPTGTGQAHDANASHESQDINHQTDDNDNEQQVTHTTNEKESDKDQSTEKGEFGSALAWMYAKGLTKFNTTETYQPGSFLTREQFAKMIRQFYVAMGYPTETKNTSCTFRDIENADPTLIPHIHETCRLGIFRGYRGSFMPFEKISKAEVLAVLLRVYKQSKLDETRHPRWLDYYELAKDIDILADTETLETIDQPANRESIALYVWRLRSRIMYERGLTDSSPQSINKDGDSNLSNGIGKGTDTLSLDRDPVLMEAIHSMYEDGMIDFDRWDDALLYTKINRSDAALMLDKFGKLYVTDYQRNDIPASCDFPDIRDLSLPSQQSIKNLCAMNVMKGDSVSGNFFPSQVFTKAQFVTTIVRMIDGVLDEATTPWWQQYYERALSWKIITSQDRASFERDLTMIEVLGFMHRLKIHALLGASASSPQMISNEFIRVIESVDGTIKAYIDSNFLRDIDAKVGYLVLDNDQRHKVVRDHIEEFSNARLSWYGSLHDPITDKLTGSVWFITQKGRVIQGTIRIADENQFYTIMPDEHSYYRYTIIKSAR